ncbi:hypothetical protein [Sinomonas atrocyanea]|uniref:hypothetical protein n=1 Tax=Sinomonas atrocyanea TaxID=37927 RepID=UPI00278AD102|nr:hypothetical protein [Sinomonas atrocyanea]MDQ0259479.1 hypothetical protein [Sinomonas atrocyanea]MDR6623524.1 hypothetical protein [Sinomonas atrocyanea]
MIIASSPRGASQRSLRTFLARAFPSIREDGEGFRAYLSARSLVVDEPDVAGYAPDVADEIERIAKDWVGRWFIRHRQAVTDGLGSLPRDWLTVDADRLLGGRTDCPAAFRVERDDLAAAMVLLALADNKGPNLSTILSYTADSIERVNDDAAFVTGIKARNREVLRTPAPAGGLFSYGGLLEFVTAATRVERHIRNEGEDFDRLLFVCTGKTTVMNGSAVNLWWEKATTGLAGEVSLPTSVSFRRLRKAALLRGKHKRFQVIGQKPATSRLYLADAVPDVILVPGLLDTQAKVAAYWRQKTSGNPFQDVTGPAPEDAVRALSGAEAVMDVGVAACVSNGQSPTDAEKPCGLGPVACFICPNGYRVPETIPGLIAAVEFTDGIRRYEPDEWLSGEAPLLNTLARKSLEQFPQPLVDAAPPDQIENARALIACVYVETRIRD